jgi:hypothetical protein
VCIYVCVWWSVRAHRDTHQEPEPPGDATREEPRDRDDVHADLPPTCTHTRRQTHVRTPACHALWTWGLPLVAPALEDVPKGDAQVCGGAGQVRGAHHVARVLAVLVVRGVGALGKELPAWLTGEVTVHAGCMHTERYTALCSPRRQGRVSG